MAQEDGGAAFPQSDMSDWVETDRKRLGGMSLRDWFAGQALAQCMGKLKLDSDKTQARAAYQIADAMLVARKAG